MTTALIKVEYPRLLTPDELQLVRAWGQTRAEATDEEINCGAIRQALCEYLANLRDKREVFLARDRYNSFMDEAAEIESAREELDSLDPYDGKEPGE